MVESLEEDTLPWRACKGKQDKILLPCCVCVVWQFFKMTLCDLSGHEKQMPGGFITVSSDAHGLKFHDVDSPLNDFKAPVDGFTLYA